MLIPKEETEFKSDPVFEIDTVFPIIFIVKRMLLDNVNGCKTGCLPREYQGRQFMNVL